MPIHKNPLEKGKLIINFTVTFPVNNWLPASKLSQLEKLLPKREEQIIPDEVDVCMLEDDYQQKYAAHNFDSSDEEGYGPQVQCASH